VVKGPAADDTDAPQPWGLLCNPVTKIISFFVFPCNGAPVTWNWQGTTEVHGEKSCPSATLSTTNPMWTYPGSNPGLRGERPATNRLSHGTAKFTDLQVTMLKTASISEFHFTFCLLQNVACVNLFQYCMINCSGRFTLLILNSGFWCLAPCFLHRQTQPLLLTTACYTNSSDICFDLFSHHRANLIKYKKVILWKFCK
jgi:hypothetical protein